MIMVERSTKLRFAKKTGKVLGCPWKLLTTLRILGPSNGGVGTCIAGGRVLKIGTFEGSGYLGYSY